MRAPEPGDWDRYVEPPPITVYPPHDEQPRVALYGPDGKALRYHARPRIGYRSLRNEPRA